MAGHPSNLFRTITVKSVADWFGVSSPSVSTRGRTLRMAAGFPDPRFAGHAVGDPSQLHSDHRSRLVEIHDNLRASLESP